MKLKQVGRVETVDQTRDTEPTSVCPADLVNFGLILDQKLFLVISEIIPTTNVIVQ
jgi:hypothetical protein